MKYLFPATAMLIVFSLSCDDDPSTPPPPPPEPIVQTNFIRDVDYIRDKFFLIDNPASFAGAFAYSVEVFVTVRPEDLVLDPDIVHMPGWAIADSTMEGARMDAAVAEISTGNTPPWGWQQEFRRLERGTDFSLLMTEDSVVVGIELANPIPPSAQRTVAVRYRSQLDGVIGGSLGTNPDTLVLEMIKPHDPRPTGPFASTWGLTMRNAYDIGFSTIDPATLTLRIEDVLDASRSDSSRPEGPGVPYAQIFGLDRHGATTGHPPDGRIDNYYLNWSADIERGILWMPTAEGFAPPGERVDTWTKSEFEFSGPYLAQYEKARRIYTDRLNPTDELDTHQYLIEATVTTPAP
jgi:hypothetical protein